MIPYWVITVSYILCIWVFMGCIWFHQYYIVTIHHSLPWDSEIPYQFHGDVPIDAVPKRSLIFAPGAMPTRPWSRRSERVKAREMAAQKAMGRWFFSVMENKWTWKISQLRLMDKDIYHLADNDMEDQSVKTKPISSQIHNYVKKDSICETNQLT